MRWRPSSWPWLWATRWQPRRLLLRTAHPRRARVRVYTPEYAGTNIHHDLYLPKDWQPDHKYPVIVEYAPNDSAPFTGSVDDTHLGFYQSGGEGFIWVSMPFINTTVNPAAEATRWWGNGSVDDPVGEQLSAEYTKTNLIRILENYGGDPSRVFLTGFSRGAIATGYIGLRDDEMADIWLGFLPTVTTTAVILHPTLAIYGCHASVAVPRSSRTAKMTAVPRTVSTA